MQAYKVENNEILIVDEETGEPGYFCEKDIGEAFAKSLREIRKAAGLTLVQLGKIIGMPNQTLSAYERNIRIPVSYTHLQARIRRARRWYGQ